MRGFRFLFAVLFVGWPVFLAGCGKPGGVHGHDEPEGGADASSGEGGSGGDIFDTTSSTGGEGGGPTCDGECYPWNSALFEDLSMFWIGSGEPPPCPAAAPAVGAVLYADPLPSPYVCPACSCAPAGCALPEGMHVSAAKCADADGAASIAWDSPGWGGSCTADGAIAPGLMCSGVPCTQSITIAAPAVESCAPVSEGTAAPTTPAWGLSAQECIFGPLSGEGCGGSEACIQPPPEGFSLCLYRWGDDLTPAHCPEAYPRYLVMYADHDDTRACEPCACGEPQGGTCSAFVEVFGDGVCNTAIAAATVTPDEPACVDLPAGVGLGSKSATWLVQSPGSCTATGGPVGTITPTLPLTLCCQEEPTPPR